MAYLGDSDLFPTGCTYVFLTGLNRVVHVHFCSECYLLIGVCSFRVVGVVGVCMFWKTGRQVTD